MQELLSDQVIICHGCWDKFEPFSQQIFLKFPPLKTYSWEQKYNKGEKTKPRIPEPRRPVNHVNTKQNMTRAIYKLNTSELLMTAINHNTTSLTPLVLARRPRDCNMIYFNVTPTEKSRCEFLSGSKLVMHRRVSVLIKLDCRLYLDVLVFLLYFSPLPPFFLAKYNASVDSFEWLPLLPDIILRASLSICCNSAKGHVSVHMR